MAQSPWKWCEMSEWHFQRCMSGLGSSFKVPEHQSTTGFLWCSLGRGHRKTQRENSLWTGGLPLFLFIMILPTFLNSAHIFNKSCYGSSMGLFTPRNCTGNYPDWFVCSTPHIFYSLTSHCIMLSTHSFFLKFDFSEGYLTIKLCKRCEKHRCRC